MLFRRLTAAMLAVSLLSTFTLGCAGTPGKDTSADDAKITNAVKASFTQHPDLGPPNQLNVETRDHVVYLSGTVDNGEVTVRAKALAAQVPGVVSVVSTVGIDK
jgi:osmotically-inducible protein OsmY